MKKLVLLVFSLGAFSACATHRVNSAAPDARAAEQSVRAHMEFLASDALNGRGSGTRDEWIAVTYMAAQLRMLGLTSAPETRPPKTPPPGPPVQERTCPATSWIWRRAATWPRPASSDSVRR